MIDVRNNYQPLNLPATPYGQTRQLETPDAQWEGLSITSDGRVDDCFRESPLCANRSGEWVDLADPRVQTFMTRMAELKSQARPGEKMAWSDYHEIGMEHQAAVNANLKEAGLRGSSSSCGDEYGALSTAYIGLGGYDSGQHFSVKPTAEGFDLELKSIGAGGWHVIEGKADNQGRINPESFTESAEWRVPWLDERILRNNDEAVIASPNDFRLNHLIYAAQNGRELDYPMGEVISNEGGVQKWNLAGQEITLDLNNRSFQLHNKGFVDPPAGSDFSGYDGETKISWQNGRFGYVAK